MPKNDLNLGWMLQQIRNGFNSYGPFEYRLFIEHLWVAMSESGVEGIQVWPNGARVGGHRFDYGKSDEMLRNLTTEAFLYLFHNGYLVTAAESGPEFTQPPFRGQFIVTERGRAWFSGKSPLPEYREGYMTFLRAEIETLDPVVDQYVNEGLVAFGHQAFFASAVMFGAAAEKEAYLLADAIRQALKDPAKQRKMQDALDGRSILQLEKAIIDVLVPLRKSQYTIFEGSDAHLMSFFEAIRVQRNDAVHPKNASVSDISVRMLIDAFPNALAKCEQMRDWFLASPGAI
jgi:hypothetical protein